MHKPTDEQAAVIDAFTAGSHRIVVEAGAGAGKTSTMVYTANAKASGRGLLVVYNRALAEETKPRLAGSSCAVSTVHALAWRSKVAEPFTRMGGQRLKQILPAREAAEKSGVTGAIEVDREIGETRKNAVGDILKDWVAKYCQSDDEELSQKHFPDGTLKEYLPLDKAKKADQDPRWFAMVCRAYASALHGNASRLWALMSDPSGSFPTTHDVYLKLFVMSRPRLGLDYVMLDEAQDSNPLTLQLIRMIEDSGAQSIYVGDTHQQLYSWRGAVDAMRHIQADVRLRLTRSFRFGPEVAEVANVILGDLMHSDFRIVGAGKPSRIVESMPAPSAIICRTNEAAIKCALQMLASGGKPGLCMNAKELTREVDNLERFKERGTSDARRFARFSSYDELMESINSGDAPDLKVLVKVIDDLGFDGARRILSKIAVGKKPEEIAQSDAQTLILTGHAAKGLQFKHVLLGDDFKSSPNEQELNLLYVSATRPQDSLCLGSSDAAVDLRAAMERWRPDRSGPDTVTEDQQLVPV